MTNLLHTIAWRNKNNVPVFFFFLIYTYSLCYIGSGTKKSSCTVMYMISVQEVTPGGFGSEKVQRPYMEDSLAVR